MNMTTEESQAELEAMRKLKNFYCSAFHEQREIYSEALDIIQSLLNAYGCKTKLWEPARALLDAERPLIAKEEK